VSSPVLEEALSPAGDAALPRVNGEVAFDAPWQGRALAMAILLVERRGLTWDDFRTRLIAAIADEPGRPYWESWAVALEHLATAPASTTAAGGPAVVDALG
jgi:hypothetical protein